MTATSVPGAAFAALARDTITKHTTWDAPARFRILHWDGHELHTSSELIIPQTVHPDEYPGRMFTAAAEAIVGRSHGLPDGYLLEAEFFGVPDLDESATPAQRAQHQLDRLARSFHRRPDRIELANAWAVDRTGQLWSAGKRRDQPGHLEEHTYAPDDPRMPGGQFIAALRSLAGATGMIAAGTTPRPV